MKSMLAFLAACALSASAWAAPYGSYNLKQLVVPANAATGQGPQLDLAYLDTLLRDLRQHAGGYPVRFDTPQDQQRAAADARALSSMLDVLVDKPQPAPQMLVRAAMLNSMAHNLDVPGAAAKADRYFLQILALEPDSAPTNYQYGLFLAGSGQSQRALPYVQKARSLGVVQADFTLALLYLARGDKTRGLQLLQDYRAHSPDPAQIDDMMEAIRNGRAEIKSSPVPTRP